MDECIFSDPGMRENNIFDIVKRRAKVFQNESYKSKVDQSDKRWIDVLSIREMISDLEANPDRHSIFVGWTEVSDFYEELRAIVKERLVVTP